MIGRRQRHSRSISVGHLFQKSSYRTFEEHYSTCCATVFQGCSRFYLAKDIGITGGDLVHPSIDRRVATSSDMVSYTKIMISAIGASFAATNKSAAALQEISMVLVP